MKIRKFKYPSNSTVTILKTMVNKFVFCKPLKSVTFNFIYISWRILLQEELDEDLCQWYLQFCFITWKFTLFTCYPFIHWMGGQQPMFITLEWLKKINRRMHYDAQMKSWIFFQNNNIINFPYKVHVFMKLLYWMKIQHAKCGWESKLFKENTKFSNEPKCID
jgi:hypothetical protein